MVTQVLTKVGAIFFIMAIGALARRRKIITDEALNNLYKIVLTITLPFLFIYVLSTRCSYETFTSLRILLVFSAAIVFIGFLVGKIGASLLKLPEKRRETFVLITSFQNSVFMAIPIAFLLFKEEGVLAITIFSIGFNALYWTFGVWIIGQSGNTRPLGQLKNLLNPAFIALILGVILGITSMKLPEFFLDTSKLLGNATIPLAMLTVGAILASTGFRKGTNFKEISALIVCRLIIVPIIFLVILGQFKGLSPLIRSVIMLEACMPSASTSPLFTKRFGGDHDFAASGVFFTTLFSIITIPIFMGLI